MQITTDNILVNLHQALKQKRGQLNTNIDCKHVANSSKNVGYLNGKKINRVIIYLRSKGCEWSCKTNGGCFMCGHYFGTTKGKNLPYHAFLDQFKTEYNKYDFSDTPMICIYNAGSILNCNEIDRTELLEIISIVSENPNIKRIVIESRPEFIEYDILEKLSQICKDKTLEIGIGLETTNDFIRCKCINKGFSFQAYLESICLLKKFKNIKSLTYLTIKPLFLTVQESINDVLNSIETISNFSDIISLEPVSIQKNTLIDYLYQNHIYEPPKGWMVKEIIMSLNKKNLLNKFELRIGGFEFYPIPDLVIGNCDKCNKSLYAAIDTFNSTKNIKCIKQLTCECEQKYFKDKNYESLNSTTDINERIMTSMNLLLEQIIS